VRKVAIILFLLFGFVSNCLAAPCYGTKMPKKHEFFVGFESHSLFKRYLEEDYGKLRSQQQFYMISWGVTDWFSIDAKAGGGNIKQHPVGSDEVDYPSGFAGGYGLRVRLLERGNWKSVFGFQHISVHPKSVHLEGVKNTAILDDWQTSLLVSYDFTKVTPYLGTRWSRVDYIHKVNGQRQRRMSDFTKDIGLIFGFDIPLSEKVWLNLEGQFLDSEAFAGSVNYSF